MMKLWHCTAEIELVIASESEPDAWTINHLAEEEVRDNIFNDGQCIGEIVDEKSLPANWDRTCLPRSDGEEEATIGEILDQQRELKRIAAEKAPLPGQMTLPIGESDGE